MDLKSWPRGYASLVQESLNSSHFLAGSFTIDLLTSSRTGEINLGDSTIMHILRYRDL